MTQISFEDFLLIPGGGRRRDVESFQFQKCSSGAVECVGSSPVFVLSSDTQLFFCFVLFVSIR